LAKANKAISLGVSVLIIIAIIIIVGFGVFLSSTLNTTNTTSTSISDSSSSLPSTPSLVSISSKYTSSTNTTQRNGSGIPLCAGARVSSNFNMGDTLTVNANFTAGILCVQYYYYGVQPLTFNTTSQLQVFGARNVTNGHGTEFDASSNFSISSSPAIETIGGTSNQNEGAFVIYTINPRAGSNGTYWLNLGWVSTPHGQVLKCGTEFKLVSGNGVPDYTPGIIGMCITIVTTTIATSGNNTITSTAITAAPTPYPENTLVAKIVGAENAAS